MRCKVKIKIGQKPGVFSEDGEELDAYILGVHEPLGEFEGQCIAVIHRTNDNDDKLVIVPDGKDFSVQKSYAVRKVLIPEYENTNGNMVFYSPFRSNMSNFDSIFFMGVESYR